MITTIDIKNQLETWVGLSGRHPDMNIRDKHAALILPHDNLAWAKSYFYGAMINNHFMIPSTCALVTQAYLRNIWGLHTSDLDNPYQYQIGQAFNDVTTIAKAYNAWVSDPNELMATPDIGDSVQIGDGGIGGTYHFLNVVDYNSATGTLISIDGGQNDGSWIMQRERLIVAPNTAHYNKGIWLVDPVTPYKTDGSPNGRVVSGRVSAKKLAISLGFSL